MICGKITFNSSKNVPEATAPEVAASRPKRRERRRSSDEVNSGDVFVSRRHNRDLFMVKVKFP